MIFFTHSKQKPSYRIFSPMSKVFLKKVNKNGSSPNKLGEGGEDSGIQGVRVDLFGFNHSYLLLISRESLNFLINPVNRLVFGSQ